MVLLEVRFESGTEPSQYTFVSGGVGAGTYRACAFRSRTRCSSLRLTSSSPFCAIALFQYYSTQDFNSDPLWTEWAGTRTHRAVGLAL